MMIQTELLGRVQQLIGDDEPFVLATVVQARRPTSVRPGDSAVVRADGTIEGFIGGVCATSSVRLQSLRALETGEALLLRLVPGDDAEPAADPIGGAIVERNPCLSGGALEIFLEPHVPAARLVIVGDSPIAHALQRVGAAAGFRCRLTVPGGDAPPVDGAAAVVVSSHGSGEATVLAAALQAGVGYVALVASQTRGEAVRSELPVADELRAQLRTPAGLGIGARTPEEIAISILAELVARRHAHPAPPAPPAPGPASEVVVSAPSRVQVATDPICGMRVAIAAVTPQLRLGAGSVYFCSEGCRARYAREHSDAVAAS